MPGCSMSFLLLIAAIFSTIMEVIYVWTSHLLFSEFWSLNVFIWIKKIVDVLNFYVELSKVGLLRKPNWYKMIIKSIIRFLDERNVRMF